MVMFLSKNMFWNKSYRYALFILVFTFMTGLLALESLGIRVSHYFSSEIDPDALAIQRKRFHGRITEIGCITKCNEQLLDRIAPIDLLIGGSPCSHLSRVNPKRKIFGKFK